MARCTKKTKGIMKKAYPLKHLIERWAGRYVSKDDVIVAAYIHPKISGKYPLFNIDSRLVEPSRKRLQNISEAFTQDQNERHDSKDYTTKEQ